MQVEGTEVGIGFGFGEAKNNAQQFDGEVVYSRGMGSPSTNVSDERPVGQNDVHRGQEVSRHIREEEVVKDCGIHDKRPCCRCYIYGPHKCSDETPEVDVALLNSAEVVAKGRRFRTHRNFR